MFHPLGLLDLLVFNLTHSWPVEGSLGLISPFNTIIAVYDNLFAFWSLQNTDLFCVPDLQ